jgi:hypothetical protein
MSYLYVKWNSSRRGLLASDLAIKAWLASPWPLPERRPATPEAARLGRSGGSGQSCRFRRVLFRWHPCAMSPSDPVGLFPTCRDATENRQTLGVKREAIS